MLISNSSVKKLKRRLNEVSATQEAYERSTINLIASDNLVPGWRASERSYKGDMIQEGIVGKRPFAGARFHDELEYLASEVASKIFGLDHAILQSHSCSQANQAAYHALLRPGDRALALQFRAGGHLTHGMKSNFSGRLYDFSYFGVTEDGRIDYDAVRQLAQKIRPKLMICGSSSYPWAYDIAAFRAICDEIGASLMLDLSHEAGLIAGGAFQCDLALADVVTMSLDKTLRGTHGAAILCKAEIADLMNSAVHPGTQSSFAIQRLTDAACALLETQTPQFAEYATRAVKLGRQMSGQFLDHHAGSVFGGGTDKHYFLLDTRRAFGIDGAKAEGLLERVGILTNRQPLPSADSDRLKDAEGIRIGTAWLASAGYEVNDSKKLVEILIDVLSQTRILDAEVVVRELAARRRLLDVRTILSSGQ